jgi:hypothetical protein
MQAYFAANERQHTSEVNNTASSCVFMWCAFSRNATHIQVHELQQVALSRLKVFAREDTWCFGPSNAPQHATLKETVQIRTEN